MTWKAISAYKRFLALTALLLCLPSLACAWDRWHHEVIAEIAEQNLTLAAREGIKRILGPDARLSDVATWADRVRPYRLHTAPWHYINYPLELDEPDDNVMNTPEGNVVWAIEAQVALLRNPDVRGLAREEALKFLVHFVGDLHQPLHCGKAEDRGGNDIPVTWHQKLTNLHWAWDGLFFKGDGRNGVIWATYLQAGLSPENRSVIMQGRPYDWMVESHILARDSCYPQLRRWTSSSRRGRIPELAGSYASAARQIVRRRLVEAGLRLALVLNNIFGDEAAPAQPTQ